MFSNIVVPLDGSKLAEEALYVASRVAQAAGATIHAVRVINPERIMMPTASVYGAYAPAQLQAHELLTKRSKDYLSDLARARVHNHDRITPHARFGDAAEQVLAVADDVKADLIVMTTHGRSGLSRWALGSVTERILRHAACPVLALRAAQPIDNILVTLDGSELAEQIIAPTIAMARLLNAKITLLRVDDIAARVNNETVRSADMLDHIEPGLGEIYLVDKVHEAEAYVEGLKEKYKNAGVVINAVSVNGVAAETILNFASASPNTMIAMSTHGRTGLRRWFYGSVTEKVLRAFEGAMYVVRPGEYGLV